MKFWKKNDGLTLVELMISIAIGSMILLATSSVLLLGLRIHHKTTESVTQQYTARTVLTLLENMASEGTINRADTDLNGGWTVKDSSENILLSYYPDEQAIYIGAVTKEEGNIIDVPILEGVIASNVTLENNVLTFAIEDKLQTYVSSVYCRSEINSTNQQNSDHYYDINRPDDTEIEKIERNAFLNLLTSQYGGRYGFIKHDDTQCGKEYTGKRNNTAEKVVTVKCVCDEYNFFSEWYIGGYTETTKAQGWSADTPWCGCFVSWGLVMATNLAPQGDTGKWFANVDLFMDYFIERQKALNEEDEGELCWKSVPEAGDIVFFDMTRTTRNNPTHVGVVIDWVYDTDGNTVGIKTIEGNSADMVAIREYAINDSRILGYGDPWAAAPQGG